MDGVEGSTEVDRGGRSGEGGSGWRHRPALRRPSFPKTTWGHRGYDAATVDAFARDAVIKLTAADLEVEELRSEIDRLHRYIRRQWATIAAAGEPDGAPADGASPAAQARAVLAHANEIAQRHIAAATRRVDEAERQAETTLAAAEAEAAQRLEAAEVAAATRVGRAEDVASQRLASADAMAEEVLAEAGRRAANRLRQASEDSRRVMAHARARYEDVLVRAHGRADQAAAVALHEYEAQVTDDAARTAGLRELRAGYLRSFARVSREAMAAVLTASGREFDDLIARVGAEEAADPHLPATPVTGLPAERGARPPAERGPVRPAERGAMRPAVRGAAGASTGEAPAAGAPAEPPGGGRPAPGRTPVIALYPDMHPGRRPANGARPRPATREREQADEASPTPPRHDEVATARR
jgi:hypothetical protein